MGKVNFTKEHLDKLTKAIADAVLNNTIVTGPVGQTYNAYELANTLSLSSLRAISNGLNKRKASLAITDEWVENPNQDKIAAIDEQLSLISLIIGFKLKEEEAQANARERKRLEAQLNELEQSQKTPADLIADIKKQLEALD